MRNSVARMLLVVSCVLPLVIAAYFLVLHPSLTAQSRPSRPAELAAWLARHPADWLAASQLTDQALDSDLPNRRGLWRAAHGAAKALAPSRLNADAAFVRAGLFHWYELGSGERKEVLDTLSPLLRDPRTFSEMLLPLWQLTRDFGYLRRSAPASAMALMQLRDLAAANGLFDDYRRLREDVRSAQLRQFQSTRKTAPIGELLSYIPPSPSRADEPLLRRLLEEMERRPFDADAIGGVIEILADYAVWHRLSPLTGLSPLINAPGRLSDPMRGRLALALGDVASALRIEVAAGSPALPAWRQYHLDRALHESSQGDRRAAQAALIKAAASGPDADLFVTAAEVARRAGNREDAARYLNDLASTPRRWSGTCEGGELCTTARAFTHLDAAGAIRVEATATQTDENAPYLEVRVDDELRAEGAVAGTRVFSMEAGAGLHRIEVRLVNRWTRAGIQRRVSLS